MNIYYITIPQKPVEQSNLDNLLNGLGQYYELEERNFVQVKTRCQTLDPILSRLADHAIRPEPVQVPEIKPEPDPEPEPEPENNTKTRVKAVRRFYQIVDSDQKLSKEELQEMLANQAIPPGTEIQCQAGRKPVFFVSDDYQLVKKDAPMH